MHTAPTATITRRDIGRILRRFPTLNFGGFGHDHPMNVPNCPHFTEAERDKHFADMREALLRSSETVSLVVDWLRHLEPARTPNVSSYYIKELGETAIQRYIANGQLLVAAIFLRLPVSRPYGPNANVGVSWRCLRPWHALSQPGAYTAEKAAALIAKSRKPIAVPHVIPSAMAGTCCAASLQR